MVVMYGAIVVFGVLTFSGFIIGMEVWMEKRKEKKSVENLLNKR